MSTTHPSTVSVEKIYSFGFPTAVKLTVGLTAQFVFRWVEWAFKIISMIHSQVRNVSERSVEYNHEVLDIVRGCVVDRSFIFKLISG